MCVALATIPARPYRADVHYFTQAPMLGYLLNII